MLINSSFVRVWWYGRADGLFDKKINRGVNMFMWCSCVDKGLFDEDFLQKSMKTPIFDYK